MDGVTWYLLGLWVCSALNASTPADGWRSQTSGRPEVPVWVETSAPTAIEPGRIHAIQLAIRSDRPLAALATRVRAVDGVTVAGGERVVHGDLAPGDAAGRAVQVTAAPDAWGALVVDTEWRHPDGRTWGGSVSVPLRAVGARPVLERLGELRPDGRGGQVVSMPASRPAR